MDPKSHPIIVIGKRIIDSIILKNILSSSFKVLLFSSTINIITIFNIVNI